MVWRALWLILLAHSAAFAAPAEKKPFDIWALQRISRVSQPELSPDGSKLAFVAEKSVLLENDSEKHIYVVPVEGGEAVRLTSAGKKNERPRWSPDSRRIAFVSDRSGSSQIWSMGVSMGASRVAGGEEPRQITDLPTDAFGVLYAPDGESLIFISRVFPECGDDMECNREVLERQSSDPVKARTFDRLLYRHWDKWDDRRRGHLFSIQLETGEVRDLTPGDYDVPPFSLGGPDAYDLSPDGKEICFAMRTGNDRATSTNTDLFVVSTDGGDPVPILREPGTETSPVYSRDGRFIAYRAQVRAGYEADRFRLMLYNRVTGEVLSLTENLDRWVLDLAWSPDSTRLFFTAEDRGRAPIFTVPVTGGGLRTVVFGDAHHGDIQLTPDGGSILYTVHSGSHPVEVFRGFASGGPAVQLTHLNDQIFAEYEVSSLEEVTYKSTDGTTISSFLVLPPNFDFERKYPLLLLIHGGPQSSWGESWSYRWNPQVFASAGFVVFLPNPRGSTGHGQAFIDAIHQDWGGRVYEDIMAGVDHILLRPYIDAEKLAAAGGSYGGYMINWLLGHTNRFRAFVSHAGVYDLRSMFGSTEELWFPIWDFNGTPWENGETYEKWSPSNFVNKFKTPTLVVHGQKDYRVPVTQSMQLFTALQLRKVPSKFLYFPDEGHWILKPRNSVHWYQTVTDWLKEWSERSYKGSTPPVYRRVAEPAAGDANSKNGENSAAGAAKPDGRK